MSSDRHLDGNALGGLFYDAFGQEMTDARGCCAVCGKVSLFGTLVVYPSGPGDVVRCPHCETVVMVVVARATGPRLHLAAVRWIEVAH
ncbi:MAG TPA: DUF6510 family protein [Candidatus Limnocylindria bacterium]|nr:DUF6510 family protein [Candidatus Limnocylindria bacterium]